MWRIFSPSDDGEERPSRFVIRIKNRGPFGLFGKPSGEMLARSADSVPSIDAKFVGGFADFRIVELNKSINAEEYEQIVESLAQLGGVVSIEPDIWAEPVEIIPNDPSMYEQDNTSYYQYYLKPNGYFFGMTNYPFMGINATNAWEITTGDPNLTVAIIDTGIVDHPDLDGRWWGGYDFISSLSGDGDGWDADPRDTSYLISNKTTLWHGAHVTGTIGARANNGIGIVGVNWNSQMLPIRVITSDGGWFSDIIAGMEWAAGLPIEGVPNNPNPARILNMSLGAINDDCPDYVQAGVDNATAAGAIVVAAAGNYRQNVQRFTPANCRNVIAVAAAKAQILNDLDTSYSNYGDGITVTAPGTNIYSTALDNTTLIPRYKMYSGTSMATPHVSGVVSLMLSVRPELGVNEIREILYDTALPFHAGSWCDTHPGWCGGGMLNALGAVMAAQDYVFPTPTPTSTTIPTNTQIPTNTATSTPVTPTATYTATAIPTLPPTATATPEPITDVGNVLPLVARIDAEQEFTITGGSYDMGVTPQVNLIKVDTQETIATLEVTSLSPQELKVLIPAGTIGRGRYDVRVEWNANGRDYIVMSQDYISFYGGEQHHAFVPIFMGGVALIGCGETTDGINPTPTEVVAVLTETPVSTETPVLTETPAPTVITTEMVEITPTAESTMMPTIIPTEEPQIEASTTPLPESVEVVITPTPMPLTEMLPEPQQMGGFIQNMVIKNPNLPVKEGESSNTVEFHHKQNRLVSRKKLEFDWAKGNR